MSETALPPASQGDAAAEVWMSVSMPLAQVTPLLGLDAPMAGGQLTEGETPSGPAATEAPPATSCDQTIFQEMCVEANVIISATATARVTRVVCRRSGLGPCPPRMMTLAEQEGPVEQEGTAVAPFEETVATPTGELG